MINPGPRPTGRVVGWAPGRVNLIGEHTDYNGGLCLPMALPHRTWATLAPVKNDNTIVLTSAQDPGGKQTTVHLDDVAPGAPAGWTGYVAGTAWALREAGWDVPGFRVHIDSDVPLGAGLSSSAALECSVGAAIAALIGKDLTDEVRREVLAAGIRAETEIVGAPTGGLDQTAVTLAVPETALRLDFADESVEVEVVPLPLARDGYQVLVADTRVEHTHADGGYATRRAECREAAETLGVASLREATEQDLARLPAGTLRNRVRHVLTENDRVDEVVRAMAVGDWAGVGDAWVRSHESLRDDYEVSCAELDTVVEAALDAGALGARMTGGGFGGSAIALVREADAADVAERIRAALPAVQLLIATPSAGAGAVLL